MHLEPTSRCTLACPACPRTWFSDTFKRAFPKQDLDLDYLVRFLDCESGHNIDHFMLNGNHGDPIYYPQLFDLIDQFRSSKTFQISTNGSFQTLDFWEKLRDKLQAQDTVYFSIDGLEHNNHLYRRNADWNSIIQAIDIMRQGSARLVCKTLVFAYNINELDNIKEFAYSKNMEFVSETTSRFGDDKLKPDEAHVDISRLYEYNQTVTTLNPQCSTQEYISADGYYWPCCWITSYRTLHQTELWKQRDRWSIRVQNLDQARQHLLHWKQTIIDAPNLAHSVCKMNCKPGQNFKWTRF